MNVSLTPQLEKLVEKKVASGRYGSASEVVREGLRLLEERDWLREAQLHRLRKEVAKGLASAEREGWLDGEEVFRQLRGQLATRARRKRKTP